MKTIKERQALAERLPWVTRLKESTACYLKEEENDV